MKGFLGAVTALSLVTLLTPVAAFAGRNDRGGNDSDRDVRVSSRNSASIQNYVSSNANTGNNWAGGSYAGDGGNGGDIDAGNKGEVEDVGTGKGGNGGSSDAGGLIETGDASTETFVLNVANSNDTSVKDDCGCVPTRGDRNVDVRVSNKNSASVKNVVSSNANTGYNSADGSYGGDGGNGGDIDAGSQGEVEDSGTGSGGHGGNSGVGGTVVTGSASTSTAVVTVVNRNVTRVR